MKHTLPLSLELAFISIVVALMTAASFAQDTPNYGRLDLNRPCLEEKAHKALPVSPFFLRWAYSMAQEFQELAGSSDKPIIEGDWDTSPFSIKDKVLEKKMDRAEMFDLRTKGDRNLYDMLLVAHSTILQRMVTLTQGYDQGRPYWYCLSSIRATISRRAWTGNGQCVPNCQTIAIP